MAKQKLSTGRSSRRSGGRTTGGRAGAALAVAPVMEQAVLDLLDKDEGRGLYRMNLLECVDGFRADRDWLRRHLAEQKRVLAAAIEAGWIAALDTDGTIAEFERRWRVRVDLRVGAVDVDVAVVRGLSFEGIQEAPIESLRDDLYIYDTSFASAVQPLTADFARYLARHPLDPHRYFVLDRLGPRRVAEPLLRTLVRREGKVRPPTWRTGEADDAVIVTALANSATTNVPIAVGRLHPDLARDLGFVEGARRPPVSAPSTLSLAQRGAWPRNRDKWTALRRKTNDRWATLKPWVQPTPGTTPLSEWWARRRPEVVSDPVILKYTNKDTEPEVVAQAVARRLSPGETEAAPFPPLTQPAQSRPNVRTKMPR